MRSFIKEARLAARIRHPNVVPILDALTDCNELFLILEYVHGEALHRLLRLGEDRPPPVPVVAAIVRGMLEGLQAAHTAVDERGTPLEIVHRDVSPQNVLVGVDGIARILDFGVATTGRRAAGSASERCGKPSYMAPEQIIAGETSARSDVYSAAVVLWEALAGRRLFRSTLPISELLDTPIPSPSTINRSVSPALDDVVMRGLERNAALRYSTAREMSLELERATVLATEREVGHFVDMRAGVGLRERARRIADIERSQAVSVEVLKTPAPAVGAFDGRVVTSTQSIGDERHPNALLLFPSALDSSLEFDRKVVITTQRQPIDWAPGLPGRGPLPEIEDFSEREPTESTFEVFDDPFGAGPDPTYILPPPADNRGRPKRRLLWLALLPILAGAALLLLALPEAPRPRPAPARAGPRVSQRSELLAIDEIPISLPPARAELVSEPPRPVRRAKRVRRSRRPRRAESSEPKRCDPPFWIDDEGLKRLKPGCD